MHTALTEPTLRFPLTEPPPFGVPQEVAPGVLWLRLPLPFRLDHINVHLIEDGDGWAVLDTGIGDARTPGDLGGGAGRPAARAAAHPHDRDAFPSRPCRPGRLAGAAASIWSCGCRSRNTCSAWRCNTPRPIWARRARRPFYRRHGLDEVVTERVLERGHVYLRITTGVPEHLSPHPARRFARYRRADASRC